MALVLFLVLPSGHGMSVAVQDSRGKEWARTSPSLPHDCLRDGTVSGATLRAEVGKVFFQPSPPWLQHLLHQPQLPLTFSLLIPPSELSSLETAQFVRREV